MAFINKETVKEIRAALKKELPEHKFLLSGSNSSQLTVKVRKSPLYEAGTEKSVNHYWLMRNDGPEAELFTKVDEIVNRVGGWFDKSDSMTDYFHTAFYKEYRVETK